jgi:hypothetical protein
MRRAYRVGVVLLLALGACASPAFGQTDPPSRERSQLGQNYPNPFNPVTRIPISLGEADFEGGKIPKVTVMIFNVLRQPVAHPTALNHPAGNGAVVDNLEYYSPGNYETYWDGTDRDGKKVASGIYYALLVINGQPAPGPPMKMVVAK